MSFENVLRSRQGIDKLALSIIGRPAFGELHVRIPDPVSPEPAFIRSTSWLYCLYFEAGRVSLTFLRRLGEAYSLVDRQTSDAHIEAVRSLRTDLHHNLGFSDSDVATRNAAQRWLRRACGTALPNTPEHWRQCYDRLVEDGHAFLSGVDAVVRRIEADGDGARQHIEEWLRRLSRNWAAPDFDPLIDDAKYRLGREALSTVPFRNRHVDRWRKQLDLLEDDFDFNFEATRLIEKTLLDEDSIVLPITGRELIDTLGLEPGRVLSRLLEEARRYFEVHGCSRDELLDHLREYHS